MNWTKVREKIAAILTIVFILLMIGFFAAMKGYNIPIISDIVDSLS